MALNRDEFFGSFDSVELVMLYEEAFGVKVPDRPLSADEQNRLLNEFIARDDRGNSTEGDDSDDGGLRVGVRNSGPKGPLGSLSMAVRPEVEAEDVIEERPRHLGPPYH